MNKRSEMAGEKQIMLLYEDEEIIVYHKPAGLAVQSASIGQLDLVSKLNNYLGADMIHVVHRLDQPVEGIVVFAKTKQAAAELGKQVTDGRMKKIYHAVCCQQIKEDKNESKIVLEQQRLPENQLEKLSETSDGSWYQLVDYLAKDGRKNISTVVGREKRDAKKAELSFCIFARNMAPKGYGELLLAEIELKTGRHHQIRVQMSHAGLPLYGDRKYNLNWEKFASDGERMQLALCAVSLTFFHPRTKKSMTFEICPENRIFGIFENS